MPAYLGRRLAQAAVVLLGLSAVFFALLHAQPGGPCDRYLAEAGSAGSTADQEQRFRACEARLDLGQPLPLQYLAWLGDAARGDFGESVSTGQPVGRAILDRLPATLLLGGGAFLVQEVLALPLGIYAASRRRTPADAAVAVGTAIGLAAPPFWLAGLAILLFARGLNWLPPGGIVGDTANIPAFNGAGYWAYLARHPWHAGTDLLGHLTLPLAVLAAGGLAGSSRLARASMGDALGQGYIRAARARGVRRAALVYKHALRNAAPPVLTNMALTLPHLLGGAIIVETIFGWPGLGQLYAEALMALDYPLLQALTLLGALAVVASNLVADVAHAALDPRLRPE